MHPAEENSAQISIQTLTRKHRILGLYVITPDGSEVEILAATRLALKGGAAIVQLRDKHSPFARQLSTAIKLRKLCHTYAACFIVNDSVELARQANADGVHLGQDDGDVVQARAQLGPDKIIGVSTQNVVHALRAQEQGANYIGCGSVYPTHTKGDAVHIGVSELARVCAAVNIPVVAIGGICAANLPEVIRHGACSAAVVSAVMNAPRPDVAAREMSLMFRQMKSNTDFLPPLGSVLTIAGSDSSGGAGIQADLKTITLLGSYASSAITALTAQNTTGVQGIHPVAADFVVQQAQSVLDDIDVDVIKTGMLFSTEIIRAVAKILSQAPTLSVVDPVMIAKGGAHLLQAEAVTAFREEILPQTYLLTPNIPEAETLTGIKITDIAGMEEAACALQNLGAAHVLVKGGHMDGVPIDILRYGSESLRLEGERIDSVHTHGTGCTMAAALAALLSQGFALPDAARAAKEFIHTAITTAPGLGHGHGPVNHFVAAEKLRCHLHHP
ncbi:MAG: bifunctional hydroxymethylpyrimidine kinase/phosphomethylpyrimidine kinase [Desulfuromonadaceae bacterium]|nr:bifunctional hydroxymethylpyrimidine kinase/phosphomethylpyrimidine kinase [Desulfuromonas sp.]MDY0184517.1 bifunctional hydroxymethylpyrimidine kinase/phosphomethylpyrimidine kinase [Desulfuromonadaceae bacterium]